MKPIYTLAVLVLLCLCSLSFSTNTDPVGTWEYVAHTEEGHQGTFTITKKGDQYGGSLISKDQKITLKQVNLQEDVLSFELVAEGYFCQVRGKIAGDDYQGTLTVEGTDMHFEAKRVE